jgi:hypothetical protein
MGHGPLADGVPDSLSTVGDETPSVSSIDEKKRDHYEQGMSIAQRSNVLLKVSKRSSGRSMACNRNRVSHLTQQQEVESVIGSRNGMRVCAVSLGSALLSRGQAVEG